MSINEWIKNNPKTVRRVIYGNNYPDTVTAVGELAEAIKALQADDYAMAAKRINRAIEALGYKKKPVTGKLKASE